MNWFKITVKHIKQNWKSPTTITILVLFPILLMLILGTAFSGNFASSATSVNISAAYLPGKSVIHNAFSIMINELPKDILTIEIVKDNEEGLNLVRNGNVDCFIKISEEKAEIVLATDNFSGLEAGIMESILDSFLDSFKLNSIATKAGISLSYSPGNVRDVVAPWHLQKQKSPSSLDFYGITMLTMIILYGGYMGAYGIILERQKKTLDRLINSPTPFSHIWLGINLGSFFSILIQGFIILMIGAFVLNIHYGNAMWKTAVILIAESFFALSLCSTISTLVKESKAVDAILNVLILAMVFLGGGYFVLPTTGALSYIQYASPIYWINKAMFETAYGSGNYYFILALIITISTGILGMFIASRKFLKGGIK